MDIKHLRIGNLFIEKHSQQVIEVIGLASKRITFSGTFPFEWQAEPIPLTEEWLIKLGFRRSSGVNPHFSYGNTMLIFMTDYEAEELENYYHFRFGIGSGFKAERQVRLDYVHQLQNLTFTLQGEDLQPEY